MNGRVQRAGNVGKFGRIGFIKCGEKTEKGARSLDYFIASGKYAHYFNEAYPDKPKSIKIIFLSDNINEVCYERYEIWAGKKFYGEGDGKDFVVWSQQENNYKYIHVDECQEFMNKIESSAKKISKDAKWNLTLTLRFLIPAIGKVGGIWEFTTRAEKSSINLIRDPFDMVLEKGGTVTRTLFDLNIDWHVSKKMGSKSAYPVVSLIPNMSRYNLEKQRELLNKNAELPYIITDNVIKQIEHKGEEL